MSELEQGEKIEREHKDTLKKIKKNPKIKDKKAFTMIAKDHLKEDPKYYTKLKKYVESDNRLAMKSDYDSIKGNKGSWETFKRLYARYGREKAKQTIVSLAKKQKQIDKDSTQLTNLKENQNRSSQFVIFANSYLKSQNIFYEDKKISTNVDLKYVSKLIDDYINMSVKKYEKLIKQNTISMNFADKRYFQEQIVALKNYKQKIHLKQGLVEKTINAFNVYKNKYKSIKDLFQQFSKDISGKSFDEVEKISESFSKELPKVLKSYSAEFARRDVTGHLTAPSKVVLTKILNDYSGIIIPLSYSKSIMSNQELSELVDNEKLNPVFQLSYIMNLICFQALNEIIKNLNPTVKPLVTNKIINAILGSKIQAEKIKEYVENNERFRNTVSEIDFNQFLSKKEKFKEEDKEGKVNLGQTSLGADPKDKAIGSKIDETDPI